MYFPDIRERKLFQILDYTKARKKCAKTGPVGLLRKRHNDMRCSRPQKNGVHYTHIVQLFPRSFSLSPGAGVCRNFGWKMMARV